MEDNYDYRVVFEDESLRNETFIGTFPADDIDVLLLTLQQSVPTRINADKTIVFHNQNNPPN